MSNTYNALIHAKQDGTGEEVANNLSGGGSLYAPVTSIATPENGDSASKAYAVGDHFIRDGAFCTAISAIAQGGSFTLNTNYMAGNVGSILTELTAKVLTPTYADGVSVNIGGIYQFGHLVVIQLRLTVSTFKIGMLISGIPIPAGGFGARDMIVLNSRRGDIFPKGYVEANGTIYINDDISSASGDLYISGSYIS